MKHRGEIVETAIRLSGIPLSAIAKKIGYDRSSLYNFFSKQDLSLDIILEIGKVIHHNFKKDIPELGDTILQVSEDASVYENVGTLSDCLKEKNEWKHKYYDILEKYNTLLEGKINQ